MKAWKIGGLIVAGIDLLFWLFVFLYAATCSGDMCGLGMIFAIYYGIPSLILAFIIGAIIGAISGWTYKIEKEVITLGSKIGFFIGLTFSLFIFIASGIACYFNPNRFKTALECFFGLPSLLVILIAIPFVSAWIIWIIGAIVQKVRE